LEKDSLELEHLFRGSLSTNSGQRCGDVGEIDWFLFAIIVLVRVAIMSFFVFI